MLSIIIPTLNEEVYLPFLLRAISNQSYRDYEVIVADGASRDGTIAVSEKWGCRIVDGGLPSVGRNNGARAARGDRLLFLDADVVLPASFLEKTLREFEKRSLEVASCYIRPIPERDFDSLLFKAANSCLRLSQHFRPHAPGFCIFCNNYLHEEIGGFNEEMTMAEDHDYVMRASKVARFGFIRAMKVPVWTRRLETDGRIRTIARYVLSELYMFVFGKVSADSLNYRFGHHVTDPLVHQITVGKGCEEDDLGQR